MGRGVKKKKQKERRGEIYIYISDIYVKIVPL